MKNENAVLEINKKNIISNFKSLSKINSKVLTGATIKANAYGLGDLEVFKLLYNNGCKHFFVATITEGINLRKKYSKGSIYILNGIILENLNIYKNNNLIPILNSREEINKLNKIKSNIKVGIHVDTGINRLGINYKELEKINFSKLNIKILLSHLSSADETKNKYNIKQNTNFKKIEKYFKNIKYKSLANSSGIILGKNFHYDITRPGISLYGGYSNNKLKKIIKPVIKLKACVLQIKNIKKNEFIGYNQTYKSKKNIKTAVLGIGYGDGISRILSNKGYVFYKQMKFPIIGRISMDTLTIDITKYKKFIKKGIYMDIINYNYDIEKIAKKTGTISNEILTSITNRVIRVYK